MKTPELPVDINKLLSDDRRSAIKFQLLTMAIILGIGGVLTLVLYFLTPVTWTGSFLIGVALTAGAIGVFGVDIAQYQVSDETLGKLAGLDVECAAAFENLKKNLDAQGYVTLGQVEIFVATELRERQRNAGLNSQAAKALMQRG